MGHDIGDGCTFMWDKVFMEFGLIPGAVEKNGTFYIDVVKVLTA